MIYLFLDENQIKTLLIKKTFINQYEADFFEKNYHQKLLIEGKIDNVDLVASAIKEALVYFSNNNIKKEEVILVLPQESFAFLRTPVATDIAPSALSSFIKDKIRAHLQINLDNCLFNYFIQETAEEKQVSFFSIDEEKLVTIQAVFNLLELKLITIIPETLTYFKLFEKTLRKDKKETIFYLKLNKNCFYGYLYDLFGLISENKWKIEVAKNSKIEKLIKEKVKELEETGVKLNRLIISGELSENIRQDTFTKEVGVWTNPLKRIIPNFYNDYLKLFFLRNQLSFPFLSFDTCLGAFIFYRENKSFIQIKKKAVEKFSLPKVPILIKELLIFFISFFFSFLFFFFFSKFGVNFLQQKKQDLLTKKTISLTSVPSTITPTPSIRKEELRIKILNGSGVSGKAAEVKNLLKDKGYGEILTGNADNFDYEETEIQIKKSKKEAIFLIKNDLKDNLSTFKEILINENEAADIIIIIGKNFK